LPRVDFVIEPEGCHSDFATSGFAPFSDMARCPTSDRKGKADIGEIETMARNGLGRSGCLTHLVRRNRVAKIGVGFQAAALPRNARPVDLADASALRADGMVDGDQGAQARVATLRDAQKLRWIEDRNILIDVRWSASDAVNWASRAEMAISLSVLSVACFIGAAISFLRYDSKYFDLPVL
jgi:hypothetical protein